MFFSQDILQKRGGKFGIVWIAATRAATLTKREYYSVNITKTCNEIIDYITLKARPNKPGGPRPRFSLYLSSQLMFGVVTVYGKQADYLLNDVNSVCKVFSSHTPSSTADIDLKQVAVRADTVTHMDVEPLVNMKGPYFDPMFGLLQLEEWRFDPSDLADVAVFNVFPSPEQMLSPTQQKDISLPGSPKTPPLPFIADFPAPHTAPRDQITMLEDDIISASDQEIPIPGEKDIPTFLGDEMQIIMEEGEAELEKQLDAILSPTRETVPAEITASPVATHTTGDQDVGLDVDVPIGMETTPAVAPPPSATSPIQQPVVEPTPGVTPVAEKKEKKKKRVYTRLELSPLPPTPPSVRRRRRLFTDKEIQISKKRMRSNLESTEDICREMDFPCPLKLTATQLLTRPGRKDLCNRVLKNVWQRNCSTRYTKGSDSDLERPFWTLPDSSDTSSPKEMSPIQPVPQKQGVQQAEPGVQELEMGAQDLDQPLADIEAGAIPVEEQSVELGREASLRSLSMEIDRSAMSMAERSRLLEEEQGVLSDIADKSRDRSKSRSSVGKIRSASLEGSTSGEEYASAGEDAGSFRGAAPMEPLPEEKYPPIPEEETIHDQMEIEQPKLSPKQDIKTKTSQEHVGFLRKVVAQTSEEMTTTFCSLCPPNSKSKAEAVSMFGVLLDLCTQQKVYATQNSPYDEIYIMRGRVV